jgi:DNA topoisomerase VI subunit B
LVRIEAAEHLLTLVMPMPSDTVSSCACMCALPSIDADIQLRRAVRCAVDVAITDTGIGIAEEQLTRSSTLVSASTKTASGRVS